jgi:hypothetical protein
VALDLSHYPAHRGGERGGPTPGDRNGVSVYYPFALVELVDVLEADGYEETGDILLSLRDEDGVVVTVRLRRGLAEALAERLRRPPWATP